jgi:hypothetical protein
MKIKTSTLDKIAILLFASLMILAILCFGIESRAAGQRRNPSASGQVSPYQLVSFTGRQLEDKKYLNWTVISSRGNYYFVIERSVNGDDFSIIEIKKGFASPGKQKLSYSCTDPEYLFADNITYRICLYEIQAINGDNDKAILSTENIFEQNENASIVITN